MPPVLEIQNSIPVLTVFLQGLVSFLSPCVLPLLPMYIGYLAGGTYSVDDQGQIQYPRKRVFLNTLFFVFGIASTFFILALGFTAAGGFFQQHRRTFVIGGGILVILFGLYQLGAFGSSFFLAQERRLPFKLDRFTMNPLIAFLMGFTFSFAWTPCIGPAMSSVLLMAASASQRSLGFLLVGVYVLGFTIPFLIVGLFTTRALEFFKRHSKIMKYTVMVGGLLMIVIGILMIAGLYGG
ncbi:MAG: cytochrome c biogenesis protein CcdA [Saccharofermentanales bacterium]